AKCTAEESSTCFRPASSVLVKVQSSPKVRQSQNWTPIGGQFWKPFDKIGQGLVSATPPQRFKDSAELKGSGADGLKIEAFIGVEVEHEAVGLFDIRIRFLPSALEA
ncbi:hypothetical protein NKJ09_30045, partial [Mesorhizobium sp. M0189]